jgi:hypothetical protein
MEGVAHFLQQEKPEEVSKHIYDFVKKFWFRICFDGNKQCCLLQLTCFCILWKELCSAEYVSCSSFLVINE